MQMFHLKVKNICRFPLVASLVEIRESDVFSVTMCYRPASEDGVSRSQGHMHTESSDTV